MSLCNEILFKDPRFIHENYSKEAQVVLYPGNCLDLLSQIPDGEAKLVVTSPPYNLGKPYEKRIKIEEYLEQQEEVIRECVRILSDEGSICWEVGNYVEKEKFIR